LHDAFADVVRPKRRLLLEQIATPPLGYEVADTCPIQWEKIEPAFFERHSEMMCECRGPDVFRFFVAPYLLYSLAHPSSNTAMMTAGCLTDRGDDDDPLAALDGKQAGAVRRALKAVVAAVAQL